MAVFRTLFKLAWGRRDMIALSPVLLLGAVLYFSWEALKWAIVRVNEWADRR